MTFQISRRGREYLKTAQTLLRAAKTMTDRAIASQLKRQPSINGFRQSRTAISWKCQTLFLPRDLHPEGNKDGFCHLYRCAGLRSR
jgi:hypothetical protein